MTVVPIACLKDNYAYLLICEKTRKAAAIDPSDASAVRAAIDAHGVELAAIWNTHHHWDHVGGNEALASEFSVPIVAHASDMGRVPGQTVGVNDGDIVSVGEIRARVIHVPGHTLGAVAYVTEGDAPSVFTGDTLFLAGCGRLFEGTAAQMHASLKKLASLPGETQVYCGHEYTEKNLQFAQSIEPSNADIASAIKSAQKARSRGAPTVPGTIAEEQKTNPFLRVERSTKATEQFAALRKMKDEY